MKKNKESVILEKKLANSKPSIFKKIYRYFDEMEDDPVDLVLGFIVVIGIFALIIEICNEKSYTYTSEVSVVYTNGELDTLTVFERSPPDYLSVSEGDLRPSCGEGASVIVSGVRSFKILSTVKEEVIDD